MLRWRIILGGLFIALLVGLCWLDHEMHPRGMILLPLAVLLGIASAAEVRAMCAAGGYPTRGWVTYLGVTATILSAAATVLPLPATAPLTHVTLMVVVLAVFAAEIFGYTEGGEATPRIAATLLTILYVGGGLAVTVRLRDWEPPAEGDWGLFALVASIAIVKSGDIGAYAVGRLVGRHKMAPRLSPGKTWEGFAGAMLFATGAAGLILFQVGPACGFPAGRQTSAGAVLLLGGSLAVTGVLADLAESLLKRDARVKDSSNWMPGFGGVLDLLDSLLLAMPVAYLLWASGAVGGGAEGP